MGQIKEFLEYIFQAFKVWVIVQPWEHALIVRSGKRIKERSAGIYFKLPYFDSVYVQESRLRVTEMPMQTLTTRDGHAITINSAFGYTITNLKQLYQTLHQPEKTLQNIAMGALAEAVFAASREDITPETLADKIMGKLRADDYGLDFQYFKVTNFAVVKTFRLIQDQSWINEGLDTSIKK